MGNYDAASIVSQMASLDSAGPNPPRKVPPRPSVVDGGRTDLHPSRLLVP
jgi:hypothetical protein